MKRAERVMGRFACGLALVFVLGITPGCGDDNPGSGGDPVDAGSNPADA